MTSTFQFRSDVEVIDGAIDLVSADGGWCKGSYCRAPDGTPVMPTQASPTGWTVSTPPIGERLRGTTPTMPKPTSFCLEGAIQTAAGYYEPEMFFGAPELDHPKTLVRPNHPLYAQTVRLFYLVHVMADDTMTALTAALLHNLHDFNDADTTTQEDAILALKKSREWIIGHPHWADQPMGLVVPTQ